MKLFHQAGSQTKAAISWVYQLYNIYVNLVLSLAVVFLKFSAMKLSNDRSSVQWTGLLATVVVEVEVKGTHHIKNTRQLGPGDLTWIRAR